MANGVFLPDFVHNMDWDTYLDGLENESWGRPRFTNCVHTCLPRDVTRKGRMIYLGHESEYHYHRFGRIDVSGAASQNETIADCSDTSDSTCIYGDVFNIDDDIQSTNSIAFNIHDEVQPRVDVRHERKISTIRMFT